MNGWPPNITDSSRRGGGGGPESQARPPGHSFLDHGNSGGFQHHFISAIKEPGRGPAASACFGKGRLQPRRQLGWPHLLDLDAVAADPGCGLDQRPSIGSAARGDASSDRAATLGVSGDESRDRGVALAGAGGDRFPDPGGQAEGGRAWAQRHARGIGRLPPTARASRLGGIGRSPLWRRAITGVISE